MIKIEIPSYPEIDLYFSLNKSPKELSDFLLSLNIPVMDVVEYVTRKIPHENGRTTLFSNTNIIMVKMDFFNKTIRYVSILLHEILHAAKRIVGENEEAEAYMLEYIFEEIMKKLKPDIDYQDTHRDLKWFKKMTNPS